MKITVTVLPDPTAPEGLADVLSTIRSVADAGFPRVWLPQLPPLAGQAGWDALTTLALAGARIPEIELGTGVAVAYGQHPFALARQALTASAATDGRLILGIGVSHKWVVSDMFGYDYSAPAAYLREYLEVLGQALAGEPLDHHGPRITAVGELALPKAPPPPIIAAALGPRMLDLAGELTDGTVTAWAGPKAIERQIVPRITKAAEAAGRGAPQVIVGLPVSVTTDVETTRRQLVETFSLAGQAPAYRAMLDLDGVESPADICVFGDEDHVVAQLRRFAEIGATEFTAFPFGDAQSQSRTLEVLAHVAVDR
jgi:F420-dependent oxidoreductase-like protein